MITTLDATCTRVDAIRYAGRTCVKRGKRTPPTRGGRSVTHTEPASRAGTCAMSQEEGEPLKGRPPDQVNLKGRPPDQVNPDAGQVLCPVSFKIAGNTAMHISISYPRMFVEITNPSWNIIEGRVFTTDQLMAIKMAGLIPESDPSHHYITCLICAFSQISNPTNDPNFLVCVELNPGPKDKSSSLTTKCRNCGKMTDDIIGHLKKEHPIAKGDKPSGKKLNLVAEALVDLEQSVKADMDAANATREEARELASKPRTPAELLKDELAELQLTSQVITAREQLSVLQNSILPHGGPGPDEWAFSSGITIAKEKFKDRIVVGELKPGARVEPMDSWSVFCFKILFAFMVWMGLLSFGPLSFAIVEWLIQGYYTHISELSVALSHIRSTLDPDFDLQSFPPHMRNTYVLYYSIVVTMWSGVFLYYLLCYSRAAVRSKLIAVPVGKSYQLDQEHRPQFDLCEKRIQHASYQHYRLYVEHKLAPKGWCCGLGRVFGKRKYVYKTNSRDLPKQWLRTGTNPECKLKKSVLLSPEMLKLMINRRTLTADGTKPEVALDGALRLLSACAGLQEDYATLKTEGRSAYRDASLVYGAIVCRDIYHENHHF